MALILFDRQPAFTACSEHPVQQAFLVPEGVHTAVKEFSKYHAYYAALSGNPSLLR